MTEQDEQSGEAGGARRGRTTYPVLSEVTTRWSDNDIYGHVNNVVYYSYFDTVVNRYLIEQGALDIHGGEVIGLVVQSRCDYFAPLAFPDPVVAGISVARLGNSSVHYRIALFGSDGDEPAAEGRFVHVYVDRHTRRPVALPQRLRQALIPLVDSSADRGRPA
ncbi:MAG: thioesterase family protein [Burkholderiaceae bacterium]